MSEERSEIESKIDPQEFRNTLGRFATGVTVVTTEVAGQVHGMTASAFMSVSLDPPLVVISVDTKAHLHSLLTKGVRYGVSILNDEQIDYSNHFAGFGPEDFKPEFNWIDGMPLIRRALGHLITRVVDMHLAGDHTLFVARVEWLQWYEEGAPLLYYRGRYGKYLSQ